MSVAMLDEWRTPGCGEACFRQRHDPASHERYGYVLALVQPYQPVIRTGPLTIDLSRHLVTVNGEDVRLTNDPRASKTHRRWRLLECLALRLGQTVPFRTILQEVYDYDEPHPIRTDRRLIVDGTSRLRHALGPAASLIVTVPGIGLRLERAP